MTAAVKPFGEIDQLIVLNGAEGLSQALAQAMAQGAAGQWRRARMGPKTSTKGWLE